MLRKSLVTLTALAGIAATAIGLAPLGSQAASHREAPLISKDATADISDFFMFRSYEPGKSDNVVLIMNVIPGEEPSSGPNYWNFDPNVRYSFSIDNDATGGADEVVIEVTFKTEIRGAVAALGLPLSFLGNVPPSSGSIVPPITALDGPGSEGLGLRQKYTVTLIRNGTRQTLAEDLYAVPSNVGPRTMPDYPALAAQGVYELDGGVRVFAGQRQDPFYIDLGGVFDTLNLRRELPILSAEEDAIDDSNPFGIDMLAGFNVHTIAVELPINLVTSDRKGQVETANPVIGAYASTARRSRTVINASGGVSTSGPWVQVQRLANPLVNEVIIGTPKKDRWNGRDPNKEREFEDFYLNPRLALALELVYGVPAAKDNRTDLRDLLLKYKPTDTRLSELLRLDLRVAPVALADQNRLTVLAGDGAGWPNGRRPKDDVTDIAIRVVGGPNYIGARAGDGVNTDDAPLSESFPFLATPFDGRDRN